MYFGAAYFKAQYFEADYFGRVGVPSAPAGIDPYAWFPGDPLPRPGKRYEEYATEEEPKKKRRRHRHPLRVPRALQPIVEFPEPFTPPPVYEPAPVPELPPHTPIRPEDLPAPLPAMAPPPEPQGAHWSAYADRPFSAEEENEELQLILAAVLRR